MTLLSHLCLFLSQVSGCHVEVMGIFMRDGRSTIRLRSASWWNAFELWIHSARWFAV